MMPRGASRASTATCAVPAPESACARSGSATAAASPRQTAASAGPEGAREAGPLAGAARSVRVVIAWHPSESITERGFDEPADRAGLVVRRIVVLPPVG